MNAEARLRADVEMLAGTIGERHVWRAGSLQEAAAHIRRTLEDAGCAVRSQSFEVSRVVVENIEGTGPAGRGSVVVGAHYDSVSGCPGANDNGTGVAAVLELARRLARRPSQRTIRFVAFVNEEPPFFQTAQMGSVVYANALRAAGEPVTAMLSLETMGYFSDERGSQSYPAPLDRLFPDVGNFIGIVGNVRSAALLRRVRRAFEGRTPVPVQSAAAPEALPGVGWSDHWSFWRAGYRALMFTDTAPFRYPWYHTAHDTPDKIRYDKLAGVVDGIEAAVCALAGAK